MRTWRRSLFILLLALPACYAPPIAVAGPEGCGLDPATDVIAAINSIRAERGQPALRADRRLAAAAERHSGDMAARQFMGHTGSDGSSFRHRAGDAGYAQNGVGEVIAAGHATADAVVGAWLRSRRHREILLLPDIQHIGAACAPSPRGALFWTAVVGRPPRVAAPPPAG